jgi:peptidoglycan/xylan/chitin deacetylase (PgdA/CDA1 family)
MRLWKRLLLNAYYHASYPARMRDYWREAGRDRLPIIILYYHRIADDRATSWTTSNAMFVRQIDWLREHFDLVSLADGQQRICRGYNPRPCLCITFDDGYADNCEQAIPWLVKERIPCTYFVTMRNVMTEEPFAHDLALGYRFAPNTLEQLQAMAAAGVEIGAHSYTHADLARIIDPRDLCREISAVKTDLQNALGRPVRYFAFPYGQRSNLSPAAFTLAREVGYEGVCSAYGGYNFPGDDAFHLQRIAVDDDMISLKNWVTMNPRKIRTRRYEYEGAGSVGRGAGDETCQAEVAAKGLPRIH